MTQCTACPGMQQALGPLAMMQKTGLVPVSITYNATISAGETGEKSQQALGPLAHMQKADLVLESITYHATISAGEKGEQSQQALGLLTETQKADLVLDSITYHATILALGFIGKEASGIHENIVKIMEAAWTSARTSMPTTMSGGTTKFTGIE